MARSMILSNGYLHIGFDSFGQTKDLYYSHVGLENHVGSHVTHRIGIYVDGQLSWFSNGQWDIQFSSEPETLIGSVHAHNNLLGVTLVSRDCIYNESNIFIRHWTVTNHHDQPRTIRVFFGHEFEIGESHQAHTAYYDPEGPYVIHYRNRRKFLIHLVDSADQPFSQYTCGVRGISGLDGSYRDAEDGVLSGNPIEHGPADSIMGIDVVLDPQASSGITYWMTVGELTEQVKDLHQVVLAKTPQYICESTANYWRAWVNKIDYSFMGLSDRVIEEFKKSLLFLKAHADHDGAIIASSDSAMMQYGKDTYNYMWPRDAALAAVSLYRSGSYKTAERLFSFCNEVLQEANPYAGKYLGHKYGPDKTRGSSWHPLIRDGKPALAIQEDETALVIHALWEYYELSHDLDFIEDTYNSLIAPCCAFMLDYRNPETQLPHPSYDLWEERWGVHTFTVGSVIAAFRAAASCAQLLGKTKDHQTYRDAADDMTNALIVHLYDHERGHFAKSATYLGNGLYEYDWTIDASSSYGLYGLGVLPADHFAIRSAMVKQRAHLQLHTQSGGIARYQNDTYYRQDPDTPGNAWIITTLWDALYTIETAQTQRDLDPVLETLEWVCDHALTTGILAEQLHPHTATPLSATPLSWSHAAYVKTVIAYLDKLEAFGVCLACNPIAKKPLGPIRRVFKP